MTNISAFIKKPQAGPFRAIKTPLKLLCTGVFVIFGIFLTFSHISATTILEEDFESCSSTYGYLGQGNCGWAGAELDINKISTTTFRSGSQGGGTYLFDGQPAYGNESSKQGTSTPIGGVSFWIRGDETMDAVCGDRVSFILRESGNDRIEILMIAKSSPCSISRNLFSIYYKNSEGNYVLYKTDIPGGSFKRIVLFWNYETDKFRIGFENEGLSDWLDVYLPFETLNKVVFYGYATQNPYYPFNFYNASKYYFDDIEDVGYCNTFLNSFDCSVAGCVWHFWPFPGLVPEITFCSDIPTGDCGSGLFDCPNCLTQETCEAQTCYWYQNLCTYTGANCGEGLLTQFCYNEGDCTTAGGYWYTNFCWPSPQPTNLLDWNDYYYENGDYATPTAWITGIASSTTGFFGTIGGFLSTFSENFNLTDAYEKGSTFGNAIPLARSYLGILDEFAGNLPFGDFFIFILIFTLAVGTFRVVRNITQLLKFW
jgi:hypothetical protein